MGRLQAAESAAASRASGRSALDRDGSAGSSPTAREPAGLSTRASWRRPPRPSPIVAFSDPVTGAYSMNLFDGVTYDVAVTAIGSGYAAGGGPVTAAGAPIVKNWPLLVNAAACVAPGYHATGFTPALSESFDAGVLPPGWEHPDDVGRSVADRRGRGPVRTVPRQRDGRLGPVRDPEQRLLLRRLRRRRELPRHAAGRPVRPSQRGAALEQRLSLPGHVHRRRRRGRLARRRHDLDQRLGADVSGFAGPQHADRGHLVRGGPLGRPGTIPLHRVLRVVVAGRRRPDRPGPVQPAARAAWSSARSGTRTRASAWSARP